MPLLADRRSGLPPGEQHHNYLKYSQLQCRIFHVTRSKKSILLIDNHAIIVDGCAALLKQNGHGPIFSATGYEEGVKLAAREKPALIIVDIAMPGMGGLGVIRRIRKKNTQTKIMVFSRHADSGMVSRALEAGVRGYIEKTTPPAGIIEAVNSVLAGNVYLSRDIAQGLALAKGKPEQGELQALTPREYEIFDLLVNDNTTAQIARSLHLSSKSVSNYITRIKARLNIDSVVGLVHLGYRFNIIRKPPPLEMEE